MVYDVKATAFAGLGGDDLPGTLPGRWPWSILRLKLPILNRRVAAIASAVVTKEATDEDSNWLPRQSANEITVAIRRPAAAGNGYRASAVATKASGVATKEATHEDSMGNDPATSLQPLSASVLQPFERSELRMKTAIDYPTHKSKKPLSPFVRLADSPTTGASPAGNGCREATDEDSNWLPRMAVNETVVAIRKARGLANDWRKQAEPADGYRSRENVVFLPIWRGRLLPSRQSGCALSLRDRSKGRERLGVASHRHFPGLFRHHLEEVKPAPFPCQNKRGYDIRRNP